MEEEDWRKNMKLCFEEVNKSISCFTDSIQYYPSWEEAFLMRAELEAYRSRVNLPAPFVVLAVPMEPSTHRTGNMF